MKSGDAFSNKRSSHLKENRICDKTKLILPQQNMLTRKEIQENYKRYDDDKIIQIVKTGSKGLNEDTIDIIISEINSRGLPTSLINYIKTERRKLTYVERIDISNKFKNSSCPNYKKNTNLIAHEYSLIKSITIEYFIDNYMKILCLDCSKKEHRKTIIQTAILGWWSIPGLILTPFHLAFKLGNVFIPTKHNEKLLNEFIDENIGEITRNEDNSKHIQLLINRLNKEEEINQNE